jgi:hypothetical protein
MTYQSRKRNYVSRRERLQKQLRVYRLIFIFLSIGIAVWAFKERYAIWGWLKTYFY